MRRRAIALCTALALGGCGGGSGADDGGAAGATSTSGGGGSTGGGGGSAGGGGSSGGGGAPATQDVWALSLDRPGLDALNGVAQLGDGGFLAAGKTPAIVGRTDDAWLVKLGAAGDVEWEAAVGGTDRDGANAIAPTSDGGAIVGGHSTSFGPSAFENAWVVKLSQAGAVEWERAYGAGTGSQDSFNDFGVQSIVQTRDGGYAFCGISARRAEDAWVYRLERDGRVRWQATYGTSASSERAFDVVETRDGGVAVCGWRTVGALEQGYLLKLDAAGAVQWTRTYRTASHGLLYALAETVDGFALAGGVVDAGGGVRTWVVTTDDAGLVRRQTSWSARGLEIASDVRVGAGGALWVLSSSSPGSGGVTDGWLLRLSSDGASALSQGLLLSTWAPGDGTAMCLASDGGAVCVGAADGNSSYTDALAYKVDAAGACGAATLATSAAPSSVSGSVDSTPLARFAVPDATVAAGASSVFATHAGVTRLVP